MVSGTISGPIIRMRDFFPVEVIFLLGCVLVACM